MIKFPDNYREPTVGYVDLPGTSSGGCYINTGVTQLVHPWAVVVVYNKTNSSTRDECLVGAMQFTSSSSYGKFPNIYNGSYETTLGTTGANTAPSYTKCTFCIRSGAGVDRDETRLLTNGSTATSGGNNQPLYIGAYKDTTSTYGMKWWYAGYIYSVMIMSEGRWIRHFIPMGYHAAPEGNTWNKGMWDLVEGKWYGFQTAGSVTIYPPWNASEMKQTYVPFNNINRLGLGSKQFNQFVPATAGTWTGLIETWIPSSGTGALVLPTQGLTGSIDNDFFNPQYIALNGITILSFSLIVTRVSGGTVINSDITSSYNTPNFMGRNAYYWSVTAKSTSTAPPTSLSGYDHCTLTITYTTTDKYTKNFPDLFGYVVNLNSSSIAESLVVADTYKNTASTFNLNNLVYARGWSSGSRAYVLLYNPTSLRLGYSIYIYAEDSEEGTSDDDTWDGILCPGQTVCYYISERTLSAWNADAMCWAEGESTLYVNGDWAW